MRCRNCGAELVDGVLFCRECGTKVELGKMRFCRECGAELNEGARFCGRCGTSVVFMTNVDAIGNEKLHDASARMQEKLVAREEKHAEREEKLAAHEEQRYAFKQRAQEERRAWEQKQVAHEEKQAMGFLGGLASDAKAKLDERREEAKKAAERKTREQDEGWSYQLRLRTELSQSLSSARSHTTYVCDRDGNDLYRVQAGLLSPKRRTIIKDMKNAKMATLKAVRFKGIGVEAAIDVTFGEKHVGRVLKRTPGLVNFSQNQIHSYHFEPLGIRLDPIRGFQNPRHEIRNTSGELMAIAYFYGLFKTYTYKINYNDADMGLCFLVLLLAMFEIDNKKWEH